MFDRQRPFLESGPSALRPLTMTAAAQDLEVHVSTVSRAVSGKHVDTPWGVLPLRGFFQVAAGDNAGVARGGVQEALRRLVEEEDKARPLSDDELVTRLRADGYRIARRTVAKYRGELGIESSYRRRQY